MKTDSNYVVIDQRNGHYALGAKSLEDGVDYVLHLGGMGFKAARELADKLNQESHKPEPEVPRGF